MLTVDNFQKAKLVEMGWRFGQAYGGGPYAGAMVMHVLANRNKAGWGSWLEILANVPTFMAEAEMPPLLFPSVWDKNFTKLLQSVDMIYDGSIPDPTKGALYFGNLNKIERNWFLERIIRARRENGVPIHERVADMNSLSFFK